MVWRKWIVLVVLALGTGTAAQASIIDYGSVSGFNDPHQSGDNWQDWYGQGHGDHDWGHGGGHGAPWGSSPVPPIIVEPVPPATDPTSPVPEPGSAMLLVTGLALVGAALARRATRGERYSVSQTVPLTNR